LPRSLIHVVLRVILHTALRTALRIILRIVVRVITRRIAGSIARRIRRRITCRFTRRIMACIICLITRRIMACITLRIGLSSKTLHRKQIKSLTNGFRRRQEASRLEEAFPDLGGRKVRPDLSGLSGQDQPGRPVSHRDPDLRSL
jgi:hypothetical protein